LGSVATSRKGSNHEQNFADSDDPGDEMGGYGGGFNTPEDGRLNWDWNVCHAYHYVNYGQGNVSPTIWEGDNPPPPYP
jgi:hypothetical protein